MEMDLKQQLRDTMVASKKAASEIVSTADNEADGKLTDAQADQVDAYIKAHEEARAEYDQLAANDARRHRLSAMDDDLELPTGRRTAHQQNVSSGVVGVGSVKEKWAEDPKRGFKHPREFLLSIINWQRKGERDERLAGLRADESGFDIRGAAGSDEQSTFSNPYGGFLVPEGFSPNILSVPSEGDPLAGLTQNVPMTGPVVNIQARVDKTHTSSVSGGLRVYRRAEADSSSSSRIEFERIRLEATGLFGLAFATEEILSDSPGSFAAILEAGFRDEFGSVILNERLNGTGTGEFQGINNAACTVSVSKETGQAATSLVYENIIKMRSRCWGYSNAVWLANHDTIPQLMLLNQSVGTGGIPVWAPSAISDHPDTLLGRPIFFSEYPETLGTVGDVILGNWSQYLEGTYQPLGSAESVHVRFVNHERTFKFFMRNAGTPWWRAALTPKKGSTLSPFVRLATRA